MKGMIYDLTTFAVKYCMMEGEMDDICGGDIQGHPFSNSGLVLQEFINDIAVDFTLKSTQ